MVASHLRVAIIDKQGWNQDSVGRLSVAQAEALRQGLEGLLISELTGSGLEQPAPQFRSWTHSQEIVKVTCENQQSLDWLRIAIGKLTNLWEGAQLEIIPVDRLPRMTKATLWMPGKPVEREVALKVLARQNPWARPEGWVVFHDAIRSDPEGRILVFGVNEGIKKALEERQGRMSFLLSSLKIKLHPRGERIDLDAPTSMEVEEQPGGAPDEAAAEPEQQATDPAAD